LFSPRNSDGRAGYGVLRTPRHKSGMPAHEHLGSH
jgi:hypothetical protein